LSKKLSNIPAIAFLGSAARRSYPQLTTMNKTGMIKIHSSTSNDRVCSINIILKLSSNVFLLSVATIKLRYCFIKNDRGSWIWKINYL